MIAQDFMTEEEVRVNNSLLALMRERGRLAKMTEIEDMGKYIKDWEDLGMKFTALGYKHNAAICTANAERYQREHPGVVVIPVKQGEEVVVTIDDGTTVKFKNEDAMASWLAEVMNVPA